MAKKKDEPADLGALTVQAANNLVPQNFAELERFSVTLSKTNMIPTAYKDKPGDILVAMLMGNELGLPFLQALQGIAVINGKPSIYGDLALALVLSKNVIDEYDEYDQNEAATKGMGLFRVKRKGTNKVREFKFTREDAKKAGLLGKQGPWTQYEGRMLMFRARGFGLRDVFPDILKGLILAEEAQDYVIEKEIAPGVDLVKAAKSAIVDKAPEPAKEDKVREGEIVKKDEIQEEREIISRYTVDKVTKSSVIKGLYYVNIQGNKYATTDEPLALQADKWARDPKTPIDFEAEAKDGTQYLTKLVVVEAVPA